MKKLFLPLCALGLTLFLSACTPKNAEPTPTATTSVPVEGVSPGAGDGADADVTPSPSATPEPIPSPDAETVTIALEVARGYYDTLPTENQVLAFTLDMGADNEALNQDYEGFDRANLVAFRGQEPGGATRYIVLGTDDGGMSWTVLSEGY